MADDPHAAWLQAIGAGDESAMRCFYDTYAPQVQAFALHRLRQPAEAADVVHEVMLEVWRTAHRYQGRSRVRTWLLGIAHHKILDRLRQLGRQQAREAEEDEAGDLPDAEASPADALAGAAVAGHVRRCLERLSLIHRQVVHLAFYQELSYPEIAQVLGCPPGTVKTRMMHARQALKRCLEALGLGRRGGEPHEAP